MRVADLIAYVNHDIDDATRAGLLRGRGSAARARPDPGCDVVGADRDAGQGRRHRDAGGRADRDPHERRRCSTRCSSCAAFCSTRSTRTASRPPSSRRRGHPQRPVGEGPRAAGRVPRCRGPSRREGLDAAARDFLAGMTDRYAVRLFEQLFIPKPWDARLVARLLHAWYIGGFHAARFKPDPDAARALRAGVPARGVRRGSGGFPGRRRRCRSRSTSSRTRQQFRLVGPRADDARAAVQPVPRAVRRCRSTCRSTCGISRTRRTRPGEGEREIEEDDLTTAFYENDEIDLGQLMREQFYLALPMKPLCDERLPRAVPGVRDEPEPRHVRLQARLGRSAAGGAARRSGPEPEQNSTTKD